MTTADIASPLPRHSAAQRSTPTPSTATDQPKLSKADARLAEANEAAAMRAHDTNPNVVALRVEKTQRRVELIGYSVVAGGLAFTMVNVQGFAAGDSHWKDLTWWSAWVLDPVVSLLLVAILLAGRALAKHGSGLGPWSHFAQWALLALTYTMNTWQAWVKGEPSGIVLHSVPPLVVVLAVEVMAELRERFAKAVTAAHAAAVQALAKAEAQLAQAALEDARNAPQPVAQPTPAPVEVVAQVETPAAPATPKPTRKPRPDGRPDGSPNVDAPSTEWVDWAAGIVHHADAEHGRKVGKNVVQPLLRVSGPATQALLREVRAREDRHLAAVR